MKEPALGKFLAVGSHKNRLYNDSEEFGPKSLYFGQSELGCWAMRGEPSLKKSLIGDPITDPRKDGLIE